MVEIKSRKSAVAWLEGKPREVHVAFAARCALRALPGIGWAGEARLGDMALPVLRAMLTSGVAAVGPTPEIRQAAPPAALAATSAADSVAGLAASAARSASVAVVACFAADSAADLAATAGADLAAAADPVPSSSASADSSFGAYSAGFCADAAALEKDRPELVFRLRLWPAEPMPEGLDAPLARLTAFWEAEPATWGFWRDWYQGMLDGRPMDWALQTRIALIPDEDWQKGPAHVAGIIRTLRVNRQTEVAPPLVRDEDAGVFRVASENEVSDGTLSFARDRIALALENALARGANGLTEEAYETITIRTALERHPDNASILATSFYDACLSLQKNIGDSYPEDTSLINLKNALYATSEEICEQSDEARQRCYRLAKLAPPAPVTPGVAEDAQTIAEAVAPEADAAAQEIIRDDAETIARGGIVPKWVRARFTNYVTTITIWMDRAKKADGRLSWLVKRVGELMDWWNDD